MSVGLSVGLRSGSRLARDSVEVECQIPACESLHGLVLEATVEFDSAAVVAQATSHRLAGHRAAARAPTGVPPGPSSQHKVSRANSSPNRAPAAGHWHGLRVCKHERRPFFAPHITEAVGSVGAVGPVRSCTANGPTACTQDLERQSTGPTRPGRTRRSLGTASLLVHHGHILLVVASHAKTDTASRRRAIREHQRKEARYVGCVQMRTL